MRTRTLLGAVTSALLIGLWSAPAALAAEAPDDDSSPPSSSASPEPGGDSSGDADKKKKTTSGETTTTEVPQPAVPQPGVQQIVPQVVEPKAVLALDKTEAKPGEQFVATAVCTVGSGTLSASRDVSFAGTTGTIADNASQGDITVTLKCVSGDKSAEATKTLKVLAKDGLSILPVPVVPGQGPGQGPGLDPGQANKARLSVPDQVYPGDRFRADAFCAQGSGALGAPFVSFQGLDGVVDQAAQEGRFEVVLRCPNDDAARDYFYVKKKYDGKPWLDLDPNSGERGDEVDIRAYCPGNGHGRFEADGLDDVNLHLDGGRLVGETHVEHHADFGRTFGRLICENGDRDRERFWVERDEHDRFLDLDPGHGHRGDEVDIRVHCDRDLKKLESDVLDDIELDRDGDKWWKYSGTTHVDSDADYGEHTVKIKCGDDWLEEDFFVQRDGDSNDSDDSGEQSGLYPVGGVETGGGPTADAGGVPAGAVVLGLTGVLGAVMAGAGGFLETREVGR